MSVSLHAALIPSFQRVIGAAQGWLDKAEDFAKGKGISEGEIAEWRLIEDMLPFSYQIKSMMVHSKGAIEGCRAEVFSPDFSEPPANFADLRAMLHSAAAFLAALDSAEVNALGDKPMRFEIGEKRLDFVNAAEFLFSFSLSNFYFHAVTAYDVLRSKGVPVGKLDYLGQLPVR